MYTLRNKRNILHKEDVDPNEYDLAFLLAGTQWILAELLRFLSGYSMARAGELVAQVQAPVGAIVEDFRDRRLVHGDLTIREELLLILQSHYPSVVSVSDLITSLDRRSAGSVKNEIRGLWRDKLVHGSTKTGYKLTASGLNDAIEVAHDAADQ